MEWQPINELKSDDKYTRKYVLLGFFHGEENNYQLGEHADCFIQLGYMVHDGMFYVVCGAPANQYVSLWLDVKPTHWMPLPNPPKD